MRLPLCAWVNILGRQFPGIITAAGILQAHVRIHAKGKPLFFSGKTILDTPPLAPSGGNLDIQAFAIRQLVAFFPGLRRAYGGISQYRRAWG
nr:hypothetical protein [uncultured Desulfovibrio sp.]